MKKIVHSIFLFIMMMCPLVAWSGDISNASLDKIMAISGINKQMSEIPNSINEGMDASQERESTDLPDVFYNDLKKVMEKAFLPADILKTIGQEIKRDLSEAEARKIIDWYESDLGRKIKQAEDLASTPEAIEKMRRQTAFLISDQDRLALAERIEDVHPVTDMLLRINENTAMAVFSAFSAVKEPTQREDVKSFKAQLSEQLEAGRSQVREMIIVSNIYSYRDIDKTDIEKYIKFLESPAAQKFNKAKMNGIEKAFKQSSEKMAKSLAAITKKYIESKKQPQTEIKKNDNKEQVKD
jgi:hypothetical protein